MSEDYERHLEAEQASGATRRRTIDNAKTEAASLKARLARFLTEYGPIGADLLTWNENQEMSAAEDRLYEFSKREIT